MIDIAKVLFSSSIDTFKNVEPDISGTLTVPAQSYTAGQARTFTSSTSLNRSNMSIQTTARFSFDSSKYHVTRTTLNVDSNFRATFGFYINGSTITLLIVVWNVDGVSGHTLSTFDVNYVIKQFAAPFD